jgi:hypothetical protein
MERKKYYKDGNPDVFRYFNERVWKMMTERERAMWTPFSEADVAPISKEVIEFKKKREEAHDDLADVPGVIVDERDIVKTQLTNLGIKYSHNSKLETLKKKLADATNTESEV